MTEHVPFYSLTTNGLHLCQILVITHLLRTAIFHKIYLHDLETIVASTYLRPAAFCVAYYKSDLQ